VVELQRFTAEHEIVVIVANNVDERAPNPVYFADAPTMLSKVAALSIFTVSFLAPLRAHAQSMTPHWTGGVFMDDAVRDALRAPTAAGRRDADNASNVLLYSMVALPYLTSTADVVVAHGSWRDAVELDLVNAEAQGFATAGVFLFKSLVSRARPYANALGLATWCVDHGADPACGADRDASFFSGHTALTFASASLVCLEQTMFDTTGPNGATCGGVMAVAGITAVLRIVADMHYASDTLVGGAYGMLSGMVLPYLLHFAPWAPLRVGRDMRFGAPANPRNALQNMHVVPWGTVRGAGLALASRF
jgi:membrane-associated phospholipid phosphatase